MSYLRKLYNGQTGLRGKMELQGKICLVTGGTSGIGASTALHLAGKGAKVISVSRNGGQLNREIQSDLDASPAPARSLKGDIADPAVCCSCVDQVIEDFGRLDVLVHSAGGAVPGGLYEVTMKAG